MSASSNTFILAIATAGQGSTVAVRGPDGQVIRHNPEGRGQDGYLIPLVQEVLAAAGLAFCDLARIGVVTGPGSFTGLRVGLAAARGLALALDIPVVGISAFDVYRAAAGPGPIHIMLDTLRGDVFSAEYDGATERLPPAVRTLDEIRLRLEQAAQPIRLVGNIDGTEHYVQDALAATLLELTAQADPAVSPADPAYLRAPEIKLPKRAA